MDRTFLPEHRWDRNAFAGFVILIWAGLLMGFVPEILRQVAARGFHYPLILHLHAFLFVGWVVLLTAQVLLIRFHRLPVHRKLGMLMLGWAAAMTVVGPLTAWYMSRLEFGTPSSDPTFQAIEYGDILAFAVLIGAAILLRRQPSAHKRLMLLGTFYITDAGFGRWLGAPLYHWLGDGFAATMVELFIGPDVLILLLGLYDLTTRRRLQPAYIWGAV
jgi:hypothetical protein